MLCGYGVDDSGWVPIVVPNPPLPKLGRWKGTPEYAGVWGGRWMVAKFVGPSTRTPIRSISARGMTEETAQFVAEALNRRDEL